MTDLTEDALVEAEINGTLNDDGTINEAKAEEVVEETVEEVVEEVEKVEEVKEEVKTKKSDSVAKLLKQRNEARKELDELKSKDVVDKDLAQKVKELEETMANNVLEQEAKVEKTEFFAKNPHAKEFEEKIQEIKSEKDLSYDEAFKLYAATNNPGLLMDEQYRNKTTSTTNLTGTTPEPKIDYNNLKSEDIGKMTDSEFLEMSDNLAKKERMADGFSR